MDKVLYQAQVAAAVAVLADLHINDLLAVQFLLGEARMANMELPRLHLALDLTVRADDVDLPEWLGRPPDHVVRGKKIRSLYYYDDGKSVSNRYSLVTELSGHFDQFNLANFASIDEWYKEKALTEEIYGHGTKICGATIAEVVLGKLPLRNVNIAETYETTFRKQGVDRDWEWVFGEKSEEKR